MGFELILFGILPELAELNNIWLPIMGDLHADVFGLVFGLIGLVFAIAGCFEKRQ